MSKASFADRLRYASDNTFSKGTIVLIGWLAAITVAIIVIIAFIVRITGVAPDYSFPHLVWMGLMRTLDSGTMGGDEGSWPFLLAMLTVTLAGVFVLSTLIGILTSGIDARLEALRKGRSRVIESNHTVILGWSQQVFTILAELALANANQKNSCIVILGPQDKVEMEDAIKDKVGDTGRTRIVCRTGNPIEFGDLAITNLSAARTIIILSPEQENPDAEVIKTLLAITHAPDRRAEPYNIVAELHDAKNVDVARMVGRDEVEIVLAGDLIARIIAQTCRQPGLSIVYSDLLSFEGDEIYFQTEPALVGVTLREALFRYETSCIIGIHPVGQAPLINPPLDTRFGQGDRVIAISADDDTVVLAQRSEYAVRSDAIRSRPVRPSGPERALVLGWNWRAAAIINELDNYVAAGSYVHVVADYPEAQQVIAAQCANLNNQTLTFTVGDTTDRRLLDSLDIPSYSHVVTLSYSDTMSVQQADARTLITLLHLRDIASRCGGNLSIVSEMLDLRNRNLAEVTHADDFIVSDRLISFVLAQISENRQLNHVFADIFDAAGSEIYLKPIGDYVEPGVAINFYTVLEAAARRNEIAFGYRRKMPGADGLSTYTVVMNPNKAEEVVFAPGDSVIVFAEE
jgi:ion channel POLLUX/CASTOR